jgi:DNA-binding NarL/FixJ family response regulator
MHGGSRRGFGDAARMNTARMRLDSSEGAHSAKPSTGVYGSDDTAYAPRIRATRVTVVETAPSGSPGQPQVARWIAAEAVSRGHHVRLERADQLHTHAVHAPDVALLLLHGLPPESDRDDGLTVPWEDWSAAAETLTAQGTVVILVSSGARAAPVAACLSCGAVAVVDVDDAKRALDVVDDVAHGSLHGDELRSILPCPYPPEQLQRLATLTTHETRVLFHLVRGYSADHVARTQCTSLSTVRAHIRAIFRKLGVKSQIAAVAYANGSAASDDRTDYEPEEAR